MADWRLLKKGTRVIYRAGRNSPNVDSRNLDGCVGIMTYDAHFTNASTQVQTPNHPDHGESIGIFPEALDILEAIDNQDMLSLLKPI